MVMELKLWEKKEMSKAPNLSSNKRESSGLVTHNKKSYDFRNQLKAVAQSQRVKFPHCCMSSHQAIFNLLV